MPQATIQPTSEDHDQFDDDDDDDDNLFESAAAAQAAAAQTAAAQTAAAQTAAAERSGSTDVSRIPELRVSLNPINRLVKGGGSTHPTPHRTQRMLLAVLPQCCGLNAWMVPQRVLGSVLISASMEQNENRDDKDTAESVEAELSVLAVHPDGKADTPPTPPQLAQPFRAESRATFSTMRR